MKPALIGSLGGLVIAAGISVLIGNLLYGLNPLDPVSYVGAMTFHVAVALVAMDLPAQRAVGVDPIVALGGHGSEG